MAETQESSSSSTLGIFKLERWFAKYEFTTRHLLCCSDMESMTVGDLLRLPQPSTAEDDPSLPASLDDVWLGYTETVNPPLIRCCWRMISHNFSNCIVARICSSEARNREAVPPEDLN